MENQRDLVVFLFLPVVWKRRSSIVRDLVFQSPMVPIGPYNRWQFGFLFSFVGFLPIFGGKIGGHGNSLICIQIPSNQLPGLVAEMKVGGVEVGWHMGVV